MIITYRDAVKKYGSGYQLAKAVTEGSVFRLESGIYSDRQHEPELGIIAAKYRKAIITGEYAYYIHGLTNVIPEKYDLATRSKSAKLKDSRIRQIYVEDKLFLLGFSEEVVDGCRIRIYDKERMLIELLRNKNKMPHDLYKEIIANYREMINALEIWRIQEYAAIFPKSKMISKALDEEVF